MAELATIARPYAEALFKAAGAQGPPPKKLSNKKSLRASIPH